MQRAFRIYTRTGDSGTSGLFGGTARFPKGNILFRVLGDVDELSSSLSLVREHCLLALVPEQGQEEALSSAAPSSKLPDQMYRIQCDLQDLNSIVASVKTVVPTAKAKALELVDELPGRVVRLESWIDELAEVLPVLKTFIIPSGGLAACHLHMSRAVCRRAERSTYEAIELEPESHGKGILRNNAIYLNRLSDYLFMAARCAASGLGGQSHPELIYKPK